MCDPVRGATNVDGIGSSIRDESERPPGLGQPAFEAEIRDRLRGLAELEPSAGLRERVQTAIGLGRRPSAH